MSTHNDKKLEDYYSKNRDKLLKTQERQRITQYMKYLNNYDPQGKNWRKWGCYLSERQWGTIRENYSTIDKSWGDSSDPATFGRDQALHRAYRWGEDGIAGISDDQQYLCFSLAMWNGADPCIKERLYGLTGNEGNHGEDVKEYYFYLDNTPTHSYMKYLYKYPYIYPYNYLFDENENHKKNNNPFEFELVDTKVFSDNQYFDVQIEYAKNDVEDICIRITATNCGPEQKTLHLLPTVLFRNIKFFKNNNFEKTLNYVDKNGGAIEIIQRNTVQNTVASQMWLYTQGDMNNILFTENETDNEAAFKSSNNGRSYFKNGINNYILGKYKNNSTDAELAKFINPQKHGTKASVHYELSLNPGQSKTVNLRLCNEDTNQPFKGFDSIFDKRIKEANDFYDAISPFNRNGNDAEKELYNIQRQAFAGMLWNKQFYNFVVNEWLDGDPKQPPPSDAHKKEYQMSNWKHLYCSDILLMPDKWEYPWFAAWDLAFHTVTVGIIDPEFAKHQLLLMVMEWYMHPNGQLPAYEWNFNNINPPVHAWAALNVYRQEKMIYGNEDKEFLQRIFDKLNMNFTWWVNQVDSEGNNIFAGGFLGLDNIRIFDLSKSKEQGFSLEQADGTAWMAMFCLNMMKIANELQKYDLQRKYLQHFIFISSAMNNKLGLWDDEKGFFFDWVKSGTLHERLDVYSLVGLVPLFAIEEVHDNMNEEYESESFFSLNGTLKWFANNRNDLIKGNPLINLDDVLDKEGTGSSSLEGYISLVDKNKLGRILEKVLDSTKFLSEFGVRSLSKDSNFNFYFNQNTYNISYEPAESNKVKIMGGNSNWRGPVWVCINYLLIEALRKFHAYLGDDYKVTYPNTGEQKTLNEVSDDLSNRLINIFRKNTNGQRPVYGGQELFTRPGWDNLILFYEYFHGDIGAGLGASHQTGWTGLVANLLQDKGITQK
ncbi:MAG: glucosidase [Firmicutes bacterium]|nr:glucosidase [Bacillota bacterium]